LKHSLRLIRELVSQGAIDFRAVVPLVLGLSKILTKRFNYLINEASSTLESLKHPFGDMEGENEGGEKPSSKKAHQKKREGRDQNFANAARLRNFIDLSVVKYPGIN